MLHDFWSKSFESGYTLLNAYGTYFESGYRLNDFWTTPSESRFKLHIFCGKPFESGRTFCDVGGKSSYPGARCTTSEASHLCLNARCTRLPNLGARCTTTHPTFICPKNRRSISPSEKVKDSYESLRKLKLVMVGMECATHSFEFLHFTHDWLCFA